MLAVSFQVRRESGVSLIELMIGMVVGLLVLAGGIAFFVNSVSSNREILQSRLLNQEMKATMSLMTREIRRAQYISDAEIIRTVIPCNDPFCNDTSDFSLSTAHPTLTSNFRQIEFSYDRYTNEGGAGGTKGSQDNNTGGSRATDECFGFRLGTSIVGGVNVNVIDTKNNCSPSWVNLTDPSTIEITDLKICVICAPSTGAAFYDRNVNICLTGRMRSDTSVTMALSESVQVRSAIPLNSAPSYCASSNCPPSCP